MGPAGGNINGTFKQHCSSHGLTDFYYVEVVVSRDAAGEPCQTDGWDQCSLCSVEDDMIQLDAELDEYYSSFDD